MSYSCCGDSKIKWYTKMRSLSDEKFKWWDYMSDVYGFLYCLIRFSDQKNQYSGWKCKFTQSVNNYLHFAKVL